MTFRDRYEIAETWQEKVQVMEIYHLAMYSLKKKWTIGQTANHFECSIGLVSENLRLADALHKNMELASVYLRKDALRKINGR